MVTLSVRERNEEEKGIGVCGKDDVGVGTVGVGVGTDCIVSVDANIRVLMPFICGTPNPVAMS